MIKFTVYVKSLILASVSRPLVKVFDLEYLVRVLGGFDFCL